MNCSDWQERIAADDSNDPAVAEHLGGCDACRSFSHELAENAAALRALEVDASAYTALRARVMEAVKPKRRFGWVWGAAAAGVVAASMAVVWMTAPLRAPEVQRPEALVYRIAAPQPVIVRPVAVVVKNKKKTQAKRPVLLQAIKILTDDPNVVIIWLVDDKKGDSL